MDLEMLLVMFKICPRCIILERCSSNFVVNDFEFIFGEGIFHGPKGGGVTEMDAAILVVLESYFEPDADLKHFKDERFRLLGR